MNIGEMSPEEYAEFLQKIIIENKILKELQQELDKYKNIVDELEKWLKEKYGEYRDMESMEDDDALVISLVLDKLEELKGE